MFPECRLLCEKLNAVNKIVVKRMCIIIVAKVVWIGQMFVTHFAGFPRFNAHHVGHFFQRFE